MHPTYTKKLKYAILLPLLLHLGIAQAQDYSLDPQEEPDNRTFTARNAYYLEISGNSDSYSLNYDRVVYQQHKFKAALRAGIGTNLFFQEGESNVYPVVPVEAIGLYGARQKHLEIGLGYTRRFTDDPDLLQNMYFTRIGFRYQQPGGGLLVRLAVTPFYSPENDSDTPGFAIVPRFGLSVGRSF